ncbi:glycoside hydrolase family 43 protein [Microbacterium ulmi]|uniref:Family 43 glycosylhydrolase n=1 Tax=Microbacterium ulmi TaxID=179095 RepID=A0A7Y2M166_9MICO|nr:glycoside hydrolase family 43 protein [Microbacterium ulmi]NII70011.1 alpha-N-arabinofuranosidase [Microbacterium ulmi]NNH04559.1 family 43 glycosylhydrolase [Microbacterium ulmi]
MTVLTGFDVESPASATAAGRYRNPILPGCNPDPSICRVGDEYFLVTSTFEYLPGLPIHRSTNLVDWETIGHAIHREGQLDLASIPSSKGLYAPTLRHHDGTFYLVCTVVSPVSDGKPSWSGRAGHFLVTATDPAGPWSDPVWFDGFGGIDPSLTFDGDHVWLCGNRVAQPGRWFGQTDIWLTELDPETFAPIGPVRWIWHGALEGAGWAEGPHIVARPGGGWMLVAAEGGTNRDHAICVAYADRIMGPYVGDEGNPRLTHRFLGDSAPIADIGHADLVEAADGRWWATVLGIQTLDGENGLLGRQTHLVPVTWERGRPLFAPGSGRVDPVMIADGVPDQAPAPEVVHDDFDARALDLAWTSPRVLPTTFADTTVRPGFARLTATTTEPGELGTLAFLGRRLPEHRTRVTTRIELAGAVRGGLLLRTSESAYLEVTVDRRGAGRAVLVDGGVESVVGEASGLPTRGVDVVIDVDGLSATVSIADADLGEVDLRPLATGRPSMFVGSWVGVVAIGDGVVDVDHVTLRTRR